MYAFAICVRCSMFSVNSFVLFSFFCSFSHSLNAEQGNTWPGHSNWWLRCTHNWTRWTTIDQSNNLGHWSTIEWQSTRKCLHHICLSLCMRFVYTFTITCIDYCLHAFTIQIISPNSSLNKKSRGKFRPFRDATIEMGIFQNYTHTAHTHTRTQSHQTQTHLHNIEYTRRAAACKFNQSKCKWKFKSRTKLNVKWYITFNGIRNPTSENQPHEF